MLTLLRVTPGTVSCDGGGFENPRHQLPIRRAGQRVPSAPQNPHATHTLSPRSREPPPKSRLSYQAVSLLVQCGPSAKVSTALNPLVV